MSDDQTLSITLKADGSGLVGEFRASATEVEQLSDKLKKLKNSGDANTKSTKKSSSALFAYLKRLKRTKKSTVDQTRANKGLSKSYMALGSTIGLAAAAYATTQIVDQISGYEKLKGSLKTVVGSQALANKEFARLEEFATKTPYQLEEVTGSFIKLNNYGLGASEGALASYGNTAAAMGKDLDQMIEAVADASTGEFERLKEFGIKASSQGDKVAFTFKGITTTVKNGSAEIEQYLQSIGNTEFADAMEEQMRRLPGIISNLEGEIKGLIYAFGDGGFTAALGQQFSFLSSGLHDLRDEAADFGQFMGSVVFESSELIRSVIYDITDATQMWNDVLSQTGIQWNGVEAAAGETGSTLLEWLEFAGDAIIQLPINLRALFSVAIGEIDQLYISTKASANRFLLFLEAGWENIGHSAGGVIDSIGLGWANLIDDIITRYAAAVRTIADVTDSLGIFDDSAASMHKAADAMLDMADNTSTLKAELKKANNVHLEKIDSIYAEIDAITTTEELQKRASQSAINSALQERDSVLSIVAAKKTQRDEERKLREEQFNRLMAPAAESDSGVAKQGQPAPAEGGMAARELEQLAKRYEALQTSYLSETELLRQQTDEKLALVTAAEEQGLASLQSYDLMRSAIQGELFDAQLQIELEQHQRLEAIRANEEQAAVDRLNRITDWYSLSAQERVDITRNAESAITALKQMSFSQQANIVTSSLAQMTAGMAQHSKGFFKLNKAAGIANAVVNTAQGVSEALKLPWPMNLIAAASTGAAGLVQIKAIKSAKFGGGSASSSTPQLSSSGTGGAIPTQNAGITGNGIQPPAQPGVAAQSNNTQTMQKIEHTFVLEHQEGQESVSLSHVSEMFDKANELLDNNDAAVVRFARRVAA